MNEPAASPSIDRSAARPLGAADLAWMLVCFALALTLRAWDFGSLGLDHYDEGGYACSARALALGSWPAEALTACAIPSRA